MRHLIGFFLIIISGISFGAAPIFARFAYESGVTPITLLFLRFGIASLCMIFIMIFRRNPLPRGRILFGLVLMGAFGYAGQSFCYFTALTYIPAGLVALLLYLYPALVTFLAVVTLKEPISKLKILALLLALTGTALTIGPAGAGNPLGVLLALGAASIYSVYILAGSKIVKPGTAIQSSTVIMVAAALIYGGIVSIKGENFPATLSGWIPVSALAFVSTVLAVVTFLAGLERVGPVIASTLSTIEPVVTLMLAHLILDEKITSLRLGGGLLILLAVILLARGIRPVQDIGSAST